MPHVEFMVPGPPVSYQTRDRANLVAWKATIRGNAAASWGPRPPLTGNLRCTIDNFHEGNVPTLDDDNTVKPIRDALNGLVYVDDRQIRHSETVSISIDAPVRIRGASLVLLTAHHRGEAFVYVRIDDAPELIQLPG